jgi:GT2 family glycosyltransferase
MVEIASKWAACVVYFNDSDSLNELLADLDKQLNRPDQVFICDNNSSVAPNIKKNINLQIDIINFLQNKGFGAAANKAVMQAIEAGYEKYILFSQDVRLHQPEVTEELTADLSKDIGLNFPTMIDRNKNEIFSNGGLINFLTGKVHLTKKVNSKKKLWADGSCLAFSKLAFEKVQGFDENFFMYFEDVDFCYRVSIAGFILQHKKVEVSQTPNGPTALQRSRNSIIFAKKTKSFWFLIATVKRNLMGAFKSLIKLNYKDFKARLEGIGLGLKN